LLVAARDALECLEEFLEDTDDEHGNRVMNPLLVQLRAAIKQAEAQGWD